MLIDHNGNKVGIVPTSEARRMAEEVGLDLVEVSPNTTPPVCKILDYGKYKFNLEKKEKEAKKKQKVIKIKEIRLQPDIDVHDYNFKVNHIIEFLKEGNKVKVTLRFRGRQMAHMDSGEDLLKRVSEDVKEYGTIESKPSLEGKNISMILTPVKKK